MQTLLGHSAPEITREIYLHVIPEERRNTVKKPSPRSIRSSVEIEEVRCDMNADFTEKLADSERFDEGHFWKLRRAFEKKWRDPDDVYIDVERREETRAEIRRVRRDGDVGGIVCPAACSGHIDRDLSGGHLLLTRGAGEQRQREKRDANRRAPARWFIHVFRASVGCEANPTAEDAAQSRGRRM